MSRRGAAAVLLGIAWTLAASGCSDGPTGPPLPALEVVVAGGGGQYGTVDQTLPDPLRVVVRETSTHEPRNGVQVRWAIESGAAGLLGGTTLTTDSAGSVMTRVRLGSTPGSVRVSATVVAQPSAVATVDLFTVDRPVLTSISTPRASAGDTITLMGSSFSPVAGQDIVLFSGIRGEVVEASASEVRVVVPECLPTGDVTVSLQLGVIASGGLTLSVSGGSTFTELGVLEATTVADDAGLTCLRLPGDGARYLAVVYSVSTVGAAEHPFVLTGLAPGGGGLPAPPVLSTAPAGAPERRAAVQWTFERTLRESETALIGPGPRLQSTTEPARAAQRVPQVGEQRTFKVYEGDGGFADVSATARYVGARAAIFVDDEAPSGGFSDADLQTFSERFDDVIYPADTDAFGDASDLDANQRIVILMTPTVNRLTPAGSGGYVGGFFYGLDLLPDRSNSNGGEIFYTLVPDPTGQYGAVHRTADLLQDLPAILAHEFQHMIGFNQRILLLEAPSNEALWLSEALAQMAEELVARAYDARGDSQSAALARRGNRSRARSYLADPGDVSLIVATGQGSLEERGAGFLHVLYLDARMGGDILGRLTRTTRTGIANVEAQTGLGWSDVLADWWSATYLDGSVAEPDPWSYPGVDLATFLGTPAPLVPATLGPSGFAIPESLWSSSARYYILEPGSGGSLSVRLAGAAGGASAPEAALRLRVIRIS